MWESIMNIIIPITGLIPRKGNEFRYYRIRRNKKIKKNNEIVELKDPGDPSFDFGRLYDTLN